MLKTDLNAIGLNPKLSNHCGKTVKNLPFSVTQPTTAELDDYGPHQLNKFFRFSSSNFSSSRT